MSMIRTLLWKDYRQNRPLLIGSGVFLLTPYVFVVLIGVLATAMGPDDEMNWADFIGAASLVALGISALLCAFVAGNAIAGERVDRSAEFTTCLPIPPRSAVASKALLAIGVCVLVFVINCLVYVVAAKMDYAVTLPQPGHSFSPDLEVILSIVIAGVFLFGVSWLMSSLVARPAIAASTAIVAVIVFVMVLTILEERQPRASQVHFFWLWYSTTCLLVGSGCFVAGTIHYLRRVEP